MREKHIQQPADVNQLWIAYQQSKNSELRELLIKQYLGLVRLVAGRLAIGLPQHVDKDDLISNGFFGLLEAIDRFDPVRGIKFETYAVARIRGAILDAIRAQDWVPVTLRQKARQYERAVTKLENTLGRSATDAEIAAALDISANELNHLLRQLNAATIIPLEEFAKSETVSGEQLNPSHNIETEEIKNTLTKAIEKLSEKEKLVITLYYYEGLTLKEISLILGLSEARISQLHTKAVFRLRGSLSRIKSSLL